MRSLTHIVHLMSDLKKGPCGRWEASRPPSRSLVTFKQWNDDVKSSPSTADDPFSLIQPSVYLCVWVCVCALLRSHYSIGPSECTFIMTDHSVIIIIASILFISNEYLSLLPLSTLCLCHLYTFTVKVDTECRWLTDLTTRWLVSLFLSLSLSSLLLSSTFGGHLILLTDRRYLNTRFVQSFFCKSSNISYFLASWWRASNHENKTHRVILWLNFFSLSLSSASRVKRKHSHSCPQNCASPFFSSLSFWSLKVHPACVWLLIFLVQSMLTLHQGASLSLSLYSASSLSLSLSLSPNWLSNRSPKEVTNLNISLLLTFLSLLPLRRSLSIYWLQPITIFFVSREAMKLTFSLLLAKYFIPHGGIR